MKFHRRRFLHLAGVAAAIAVLSVTITDHRAWSQTARTIKVVVAVQPGGSSDFVARVLGDEIGRAPPERAVPERVHLTGGPCEILGSAVAPGSPGACAGAFLAASMRMEEPMMPVSGRDLEPNANL